MPVYPLGYPIISGKQDGGTTLTNVLSSTPVDPLAPFPWAVRLQTHIPGSNTPLGLYQDVACTIPCTMDGDPVAAWRDKLSTSGVIATQSSSQRQPILVFVGGVPTILFDGVDDCLVHGLTITGQLTAFVNALSGSGAASGMILGTAGISQQTSLIYDRFTTPNGPWASFGVSTVNTSFIITDDFHVLSVARIDPLTQFNLITDGNAPQVVMQPTYIGDSNDRRCIGGFANNSAEPFNGQVISTLLLNSILSGPDTAIVEPYLASLNP